MARVAVLKGGRSLERQVSLRSGARVEDALERLGHEPISIDVGADLVERLRAERADVAFVALHGQFGEDGTVQELLEVVGVPYTASGVSACIRCADKVLLERYVAGRDLAVSVLERNGGPEALPVVEAVPHGEDFYDFEARYDIGRTEFVCPAQLPDDAAERARALALEAYRLFGCYGFARVDVMMDADTDELFVLEVNAIPGLTETSLLPQAAEAAGIGFDEVVARLIELALARTAAA